MKTCTKCGEMKPAEHFCIRTYTTGVSKRGSWCRACNTARARKYRNADPEKFKERERRTRAKPGVKEHNSRVQAMRYANKRGLLLCKSAKARAIAEGVPYSIDPHKIQAVIDIGHCEVSGLRFDLSGGRHPHSPSLDRAETKQGYVPGNVRVVLWCVNCMANKWGVDKILKIADAIRAYRHACI